MIVWKGLAGSEAEGSKCASSGDIVRVWVAMAHGNMRPYPAIVQPWDLFEFPRLESTKTKAARYLHVRRFRASRLLSYIWSQEY